MPIPSRCFHAVEDRKYSGTGIARTMASRTALDAVWPAKVPASSSGSLEPNP
ncbi:hypothetical protein PC116_g32175 [Phytophthora cactorum]|nr:hypothetical protein PC116_g32175 [Phytophthora cactorum]